MEITKLDEASLLSLMERLPAKELLALSQTCSTFNKMLSDNDVLLNRFRFKIDLCCYLPGDFANKLASLMDIICNRIRQYNNLSFELNGEHITNRTERDFLLAVLRSFKNVKNLKLRMTTFNSDDLRLLDGFTQVEVIDADFTNTYRLMRISADMKAPMTNLKKLILVAGGRALAYFENCTSLTDLKLEFNSWMTETFVNDTEDWLLKQKNLKHLKVECTNRKFKLFETNRSAEVTFQLESLWLDMDVCGDHMDDIIAGQQSLTSCTFTEQYGEISAKNKVLRAMLMLPKLKTLTLENVESIDDLTEVRNTSIKKLVIMGMMVDFSCCFKKKPDCSEFLKDLLIICESVEVIECESQNFQACDLPPNVLHKLQLPNCDRLYYQPEAIPEDQHAFEEQFLSFVRRTETIKDLTIGNKQWLQHKQFGLSLGFIKDLLNFLPNLRGLEIYSNKKAKRIFDYATTFKSQLSSLKVRHSMGKYCYIFDENSDSEEETEESEYGSD